MGAEARRQEFGTELRQAPAPVGRASQRFQIPLEVEMIVKPR